MNVLTIELIGPKFIVETNMMAMSDLSLKTLPTQKLFRYQY